MALIKGTIKYFHLTFAPHSTKSDAKRSIIHVSIIFYLETVYLSPCPTPLRNLYLILNYHYKYKRDERVFFPPIRINLITPMITVVSAQLSFFCVACCTWLWWFIHQPVQWIVFILMSSRVSMCLIICSSACKNTGKTIAECAPRDDLSSSSPFLCHWKPATDSLSICDWIIGRLSPRDWQLLLFSGLKLLGHKFHELRINGNQQPVQRIFIFPPSFKVIKEEFLAIRPFAYRRTEIAGHSPFSRRCNRSCARPVIDDIPRKSIHFGTQPAYYPGILLPLSPDDNDRSAFLAENIFSVPLHVAQTAATDNPLIFWECGPEMCHWFESWNIFL